MQVKFDGNVSSQAGETVTLTITKPDATTEVLTALTLADKTYSATTQYEIAGNYSVVAHVDESANYFAWDSAPKAFIVGKTARTGTLNVTVT